MDRIFEDETLLLGLGSSVQTGGDLNFVFGLTLHNILFIEIKYLKQSSKVKVLKIENALIHYILLQSQSLNVKTT